ncbi:MAG: hypothetical protein WDA11_11335 [Thiohalomonadaceae bacterium]
MTFFFIASSFLKPIQSILHHRQTLACTSIAIHMFPVSVTLAAITPESFAIQAQHAAHDGMKS